MRGECVVGNGQHMSVTLVSTNREKVCTMKNCLHQNHQEQTHCLRVNVHYPHVEQAVHHTNLATNTAIIRSVEVNIRSTPKIEADVTGQLGKGTIIQVIDVQGSWVHVQTNQLKGWTFLSEIDLYETIKQKEQQIGETHQTFICEDCISTLNWQDFYSNEIESNQHHHVVGNYLFSYLPTAVAMEMEMPNHMFVASLTNRITEEVDSGKHGTPNRFQKEEMIRNYTQKRPQ